MIIRRIAGLLLAVMGCAAVVIGGVGLVWPRALQPDYGRSLPRMHTVEPVSAPGSGHPIGMLEIPRLGLSSIVLEGDRAATLLLGVGHLSDTPMPWRAGNSVFAAHRDTFFRPLEGIRRNDVIRFATADAALEYVVQETRIVEPTDVDVLAPTSSATLTLITCYPFDYIGPAPKRFIVRAERRDHRPGSDGYARTSRQMGSRRSDLILEE
jgi:LPXTG-site transpeptidase (sortase) family protein